MISLKLLIFVIFEHGACCVTRHYSFSLMLAGGGELGSCLRLGEVLEGEDGMVVLDPRISPDILVGGGWEGGLL